MQRPTVLLAEDDPIIAMDLRLLMEQAGIHVVDAPDSSLLEEQCAQWHPAGVVLNGRYSEMGDGLLLAKKLKQRFDLQAMFVTGMLPRELESSPLFDPSYAVMYKPFLPANFRKRVLEWLFA